MAILVALYLTVGLVAHCFKTDDWSVVKTISLWPVDVYNLFFGKAK